MAAGGYFAVGVVDGFAAEGGCGVRVAVEKGVPPCEGSPEVGFQDLIAREVERGVGVGFGDEAVLVVGVERPGELGDGCISGGAGAGVDVDDVIRGFPDGAGAEGEVVEQVSWVGDGVVLLHADGEFGFEKGHGEGDVAYEGNAGVGEMEVPVNFIVFGGEKGFLGCEETEVERGEVALEEVVFEGRFEVWVFVAVVGFAIEVVADSV